MEEKKIIMAWGDENGNGKTTLVDLKNYVQIPDNNKEKISEFIYWRLYERYIKPFEYLSDINKENIDSGQHEEANEAESTKKQYKFRIGFSIMANMCLLIETLETFKQGEDDSNRKSENFFKRFFDDYKQTHFQLSSDEMKKIIGKGEYNFYKNVRCGILHQGETTGGWRINNGDKAIDVAKKLIDAKLFKDEMLKILKEIRENIKTNNTLAINCTKKVNAIINNCQ